MTGHRLFLLGSMAVWLAIVAIIVISAVERVSVPPWGNISGDLRSEEIEGTVQVGQQFTAPYPGLYRIEVTLDPAAVRNPQPITLQLKHGPTASTVLAAEEFSTRDVGQDGPVSLEFPPMRDSEAQTFYFFLQSSQSTPGDAVTAHYDPDSILDGASAYYSSQPIRGNLKFRTLYSLRTRDKIGLLLGRMASGRPYILGTKGFYVGLAVAYFVVLGVFLWQTAQAILEDECP